MSRVEPHAWFRSSDFVFNFSIGKDRPQNATSNPDEWTPLYLSAPVPQNAKEPQP